MVLNILTVLLTALTILLTLNTTSRCLAATNILKSNPPEVKGVLTACAGQQISLTCSHNHVVTSTTEWQISSPVNCTTTVAHQPPTSADPCGSFFMFQSITPVEQGVRVLNSTAVATANTNMNGSIVQCIAGNIFSHFPVGNISLCITEKPAAPHLTCESTTDGFEIKWDAVTPSSCSTLSIAYNISITNELNMMNSSLSLIVTSTDIKITSIFHPGLRYIVSVTTVTGISGACNSEPAIIICPASDTVLSTLPIPTNYSESPESTVELYTQNYSPTIMVDSNDVSTNDGTTSESLSESMKIVISTIVTCCLTFVLGLLAGCLIMCYIFKKKYSQVYENKQIQDQQVSGSTNRGEYDDIIVSTGIFEMGENEAYGRI